MRTFIATMNVDHDGVRYVPGSRIELGEDAAARLVRAGAVEPLELPVTTGDAEQGGKSESAAGTPRRSRKGAS